MFTIQVRVRNENQAVPAPEELTKWEDCINIPELKTIKEAETFLDTMQVKQLEPYGLEFQIIEK